MVAVKILDFSTVDVPVHEEESRQGLNSSSIQTDGTILPVTKPLNMVDVLVCQIDTTRIADLPINDQNLTVVSVVISHCYTGDHLVKFMGINSHLSQSFGIVPSQGCHTADIVIKEFDFDPLFHFLL